MIKELIKNAEHHKEFTQSIVERVRTGKHAYIHRRTNLIYVMKNDFLQTNRCDFVIGKKNSKLNDYLITSYNCLIDLKF